ncbi:MAG TPA: ubiquitin-conjugating enzyme E2 [Candidatus Methanomethylophilaceae archaeon]|nr:ubiquitin-conjugating enzyme E2 [Candidatus Methanomethylophilaceae archaeon]
MGLVRPILLKRINNEIDNLNEYLELTIGNIPDSVEFPIILSIYLSNAPARASRDAEIRRHRFDLVISSDYPFERPRAKWKTRIFHPNIMSPGDGGLVCVKSLDNWHFGSDLTSFVMSIESLLMEPNPNNPYGTGSCIEAARWYISNKPKFSAQVSYGDKLCLR